MLNCFIGLVLAVAAADDIVIADFESADYGNWTATGTAFGSGPAKGTLPNQQTVSGFLGRGLANSFLNGDGSKGSLTSPPIRIERKYINFLIGGGNHPEKTAVQFVVDDRVVHSATGTATTPADDEHLSWRSWDVGDLAGKSAQIRIVDNHTGGWGHVNADHFVQSDTAKMQSYANEPLTLAMTSVAGAAGRVQNDPNRPKFHVLPPALWINDPNGPIHFGGYYHLFYQHNPFGDRWEHMHWGHVRSKDLVTWEHLPIALSPSKEKGEDHIFSGSAVVDAGGKPMIFYTSIGHGRPPEQWAAIGSDDLLTWAKHPRNPLLTEKLHGDLKVDDWRDPFLFRKGDAWYMVVGGHRAGGKGCILLYRSSDLVDWKFVGIPFEGEEGNWECPNFFEIDGKWVLIYSPHGIVKHYVGDFDFETHKFRPLYHGTFDYGGDYYAPNGFADLTGRWLEWGWIRGFPGGRGWNGCLSLPRVLSVGRGNRLMQGPAPELEKLRQKQFVNIRARDIFVKPFPLDGVATDAFEINAEIDLGAANDVSMTIITSADGKRMIPFKITKDQLAVGEVKMPLEAAGRGKHRIRVFCDRTVLEVFADDTVCYTRVLPQPVEFVNLELESGGGGKVVRLDGWTMGSIWGDADAGQ